MNEIFGFIGCGNMGGALASAVAKSKMPKKILLCDVCAEKAETLAKKLGAEAVTLDEVAAKATYIFLGVKPQGFEGLFDTIRPILQKRPDRFVLVSMAAGISIDAVEKFAACRPAVIRIMPNMAASVGKGMILCASNAATTEEQMAAFMQAMEPSGILDTIPEDKIDAASALSGCGPAFVYLFAEALADGAVECGLPRDKAMLYAAQTLSGAAEMLLKTGKHPGELKDAVCSPGGTTIAGVHALESGAFRASTMEAVTAAYERTLELKK